MASCAFNVNLSKRISQSSDIECENLNTFQNINSQLPQYINKPKIKTGYGDCQETEEIAAGKQSEIERGAGFPAPLSN
jgi:hypothetical protein